MKLAFAQSKAVYYAVTQLKDIVLHRDRGEKWNYQAFFATDTLCHRNFVFSISTSVVLQEDIFPLAEWTRDWFGLSEVYFLMYFPFYCEGVAWYESVSTRNMCYFKYLQAATATWRDFRFRRNILTKSFYETLRSISNLYRRVEYTLSQCCQMESEIFRRLTSSKWADPIKNHNVRKHFANQFQSTI